MRHPHSLTLVTPSYAHHFNQWTTFFASILRSNQIACGEFSVAEHYTIVSNDLESRQFTERLHLLTGTLIAKPRMRMHIRTFSDTLSLARTRLPELEARAPTTKGNSTPISASDLVYRLVSQKINPHWLEGLKKVYGCLAFGAPNGVCFLIDSESLVLRNSLCHAAGAVCVDR